MLNYITLHEAKKQLKIIQTTDDELIQQWIERSTALINWWKDRRYDIYQETMTLDCPRGPSNPIGVFDPSLANPVSAMFSTKLSLKVPDLLRIIQLLNGDAVEIIANETLLFPRTPPFERVYLSENSGKQWLPNSLEYMQAISLKGWFGYNSNYPACFVGSGDKILNSGGIDADDILITVESIDDVADDLIAPRFQAGQMLRIEDEFCLILSATLEDYTAQLEVVRAFNGTTAASHAENTPIKIYRVPGDITQTCIRLVQWRYRQKDSDQFDRTFDLGSNVISTPSAIPADVRMILGARKMTL